MREMGGINNRHLRKRFRDHKFAHRPNPGSLLALGGFKASRPFGERNGRGVFFIFTRCLMPNPKSQSFKNESLQEIAAAMPMPGYAYAKKIAKLTKEIKIKAS
jgi:hypothetical protein